MWLRIEKPGSTSERALINTDHIVMVRSSSAAECELQMVTGEKHTVNVPVVALSQLLEAKLVR
jgi:hypothetical protein